uniref:Rhodanese domain-containing protein n=1 Tax=Ditylum brightwellii TaxID=49249 RepID=A0A7S2EFL2_9STRA|mmetsp:Transcript_27477/g.40839  ORF Transcript_27477/g.40839 Transcript_27477/m.40839 type:complete len:612 (+) Transcript_27477:537-2372(+)
MPLLEEHQRQFCEKRHMRGRILLSVEGINGTLSAANEEVMEEYIRMMNTFHLTTTISSSLPSSSSSSCETTTVNTTTTEKKRTKGKGLFRNIEYKKSKSSLHQREPFPDLKISLVSEIVSTGHTVHVNEIQSNSATHLSPTQFHNILQHHHNTSSSSSHNKNTNGEKEEGEEKKELVLIDVRNTFEHAIGHFLHPTNNKPAINPNTTTFSSFDSTFCAANASSLANKTVLMYCTGGIRCEKASVMLKRRGVEDVYQLSGGIHEYVQQFGDGGFFKGKNFVFDQRVALSPSASASSTTTTQHINKDEEDEEESKKKNTIVGKCIECSTPYDTISGSILCTVCRDLILLCKSCQQSLLEYHCTRHSTWKHCYYTFLESFDIPTLQQQYVKLQTLLQKYVPPKEHKNVRKTLRKQMYKVKVRLEQLENGIVNVDVNAKRRCRTCRQSVDICDGLCWGFWRHSSSSSSSPLSLVQNITGDDESSCSKKSKCNHDIDTNQVSTNISGATTASVILQVNVGDRIQPGPHWNEHRLGPKQQQQQQPSSSSSQAPLKQGTVIQLKTWGSGGDEYDCVSVLWDDDDKIPKKDNVTTTRAQIYRWGVLIQDGTRVYDLEHC